MLRQTPTGRTGSMWAVVLAAFVFGTWAIEGSVSASPSTVCKKKKKKAEPKKAKKPAVASARAQKIDEKSVLRWWRHGVKEEEILARAQRASWRPTVEQLRKLEARAIPESLLSALSAGSSDEGEAEVAVAKPKSKSKADLTRPADPAEIDFDSVAPPKGSASARAEPVSSSRRIDIDASSGKASAPVASAGATNSASRSSPGSAPAPSEAPTGRRKPIVATE